MIDRVFFITGVFFLLVLTLLDFWSFNKKQGFIPSVLTTTFLIISFLFGVFYNESLVSILAIFGVLIGLLFTDLDLWGGIADLKTFVACCMLFPHGLGVLLFAFCVSALNLLIKGVVKWKIVKKGKSFEIPFIPVLLIAFIIASFLI